MLFTTPEVTNTELQVLGQIEKLKEQLRWQLHEPRRWSGTLRRLSFARAIQGSNSIEGFDATLDDAAAVAVGEEPLDTAHEAWMALAGYRDAMTYVLQLASDPGFVYSEQLIKSLHFMMTSYDLKNRPGLWRSGAVYVRNDETGEIVYEGPEVEDVSDLMGELVEVLNKSDGPDVVRGGMAHLNLVMIHPFRDGNGRVARCLQSLVLARGGVLSPVFMSIEEYMGRNTLEYYRVLADVGGGSWQPERDARRWLRFTLTAHLRQARTLLRRVKESERLWLELEALAKARGLTERSIVAMADAALGLRVRNATYRAYLTQTDEPISDQTASRDLRQLVEADLLVPHGERRGRYYVAAPALAAIRAEILAARDPQDDSDPFASAD